MARIDIRDAKVADFSSRRQLAKTYLTAKAGAQNSRWSYYEGADLLRHCVETAAVLNVLCRNSFELELTGLDDTVGVDCVEAQGLRTLKDMQSLIRRFVRESPKEAGEAGELIGIMAFMRYADPQRCPESAEAAAARADRAKRTARAAGGDAGEQYQLGLRTSGSESAHLHCLAAKQGHAAAQYEYGRYYEIYQSDAVSAYRWYRLSEQQNYWQAPGAVSRLEQNLSPAELAEARRLLEGWQRESCPAL